ncbi:MAG: peptidoglycan editing factor PgeF [Omnitrophica WOR_2 bacterium]
MTFQDSGNIRYYTFNSLSSQGITHAVFTRRGGASPEPWAALNMGSTVGDSPERVEQNRRMAFQAVGCAYETMFDVWQVHSVDVVIAEAPRPANQPHRKADAILTNRPGIPLFMRFADCVPILLYDPVRRVIGIVHAGWIGTVHKVLKASIEAMENHFGSRPPDLIGAIGPSIAPHHYEVGSEVVEQVGQAFKADARALLRNHNGGVQFDLWAANRLILEQAGVQQIEIAGICTVCHLDDWYSHRGEHGKTGRFGALICL